MAEDIGQGICIPIPATQDRLLPPWARIAGGLSAHPTGLALLISKQTFQKKACILRNTLLPEQWTYPLLDLTKRRRPQRKRHFNRRGLRPRCSNHGCPWIQKTPQKATVMLGSPAIPFANHAAPCCQALARLLLHPLRELRRPHQAGLHPNASEARCTNTLLFTLSRRDPTAPPRHTPHP